MSIEPYVYPPRDTEEAERCWDEHYANIDCRNGIEEIINNGFDGSWLEGRCAREAIEKFGIRRVELVLAETVQKRSWDKRFSRRTLEWANARSIPPEEQCRDYVLTTHPTVVDGFVQQYLQTVEEMAREAVEEPEETVFPQMTL